MVSDMQCTVIPTFRGHGDTSVRRRNYIAQLSNRVLVNDIPGHTMTARTLKLHFNYVLYIFMVHFNVSINQKSKLLIEIEFNK